MSMYEKFNVDVNQISIGKLLEMCTLYGDRYVVENGRVVAVIETAEAQKEEGRCLSPRKRRR